MKKILIAVLVVSSIFAIEANAGDIYGHVYPNSTPVQKVCDSLLLKSDARCESQDEYTVVAIVVKETDTAEYHEIEAINALIKKEEFATYIDKNVKATLNGTGPLATITEVIN
jgi:hypothetical protein